jgi:hypothetical protein
MVEMVGFACNCYERPGSDMGPLIDRYLGSERVCRARVDEMRGDTEILRRVMETRGYVAVYEMSLRHSTLSASRVLLGSCLAKGNG